MRQMKILTAKYAKKEQSSQSENTLFISLRSLRKTFVTFAVNGFHF